MKVWPLPTHQRPPSSVPENTSRVVNFAMRILFSATIIIPVAIGIYEIHFFHPEEHQLPPTKSWAESALRIISYLNCGLEVIWSDYPIEFLKNCTREEMERIPFSTVLRDWEIGLLISNPKIRDSAPLFRFLVNSPMLNREDFPLLFSKLDWNQKQLFLSQLAKANIKIPPALLALILNEQGDRAKTLIVATTRDHPDVVVAALTMASPACNSRNLELIVTNIQKPLMVPSSVLGIFTDDIRKMWLKRCALELSLGQVEFLFPSLSENDQGIVLESIRGNTISDSFLLTLLPKRGLALQVKRFFEEKARQSPAHCVDLVIIAGDFHPLLLECLSNYLAERPVLSRRLYSQLPEAFFSDITYNSYSLFFWNLQEDNFSKVRYFPMEKIHNIAKTGMPWEFFKALPAVKRERIDFSTIQFIRVDPTSKTTTYCPPVVYLFDAITELTPSQLFCLLLRDPEHLNMNLERISREHRNKFVELRNLFKKLNDSPHEMTVRATLFSHTSLSDAFINIADFEVRNFLMAWAIENNRMHQIPLDEWPKGENSSILNTCFQNPNQWRYLQEHMPLGDRIKLANHAQTSPSIAIALLRTFPMNLPNVSLSPKLLNELGSKEEHSDLLLTLLEHAPHVRTNFWISISAPIGIRALKKVNLEKPMNLNISILRALATDQENKTLLTGLFKKNPGVRSRLISEFPGQVAELVELRHVTSPVELLRFVARAPSKKIQPEDIVNAGRQIKNELVSQKFTVVNDNGSRTIFNTENLLTNLATRDLSIFTEEAMARNALSQIPGEMFAAVANAPTGYGFIRALFPLLPPGAQRIVIPLLNKEKQTDHLQSLTDLQQIGKALECMTKPQRTLHFDALHLTWQSLLQKKPRTLVEKQKYDVGIRAFLQGVNIRDTRLKPFQEALNAPFEPPEYLDLEQSEYRQNVPEKYLCFLTNEMMSDPVTIITKTVYDRSSLKRLPMDKTGTRAHPETRAPFTMSQVHAETQLKAEIKAWVEANQK